MPTFGNTGESSLSYSVAGIHLLHASCNGAVLEV
jgi:hypothetical protein